MNSEPSPDGIFLNSRLLPFTQAEVFAAFADGSQLARWWGPDGFSNSFEIFEFRPQGRRKFVMHGPDGKNYPNENIFLETSPGRVVIRHDSQPHFTLSVTLEARDKQTLVEWKQAFEDPGVAAGIWHIIVPANEKNLDRLHRVLAAQQALD